MSNRIERFFKSNVHERKNKKIIVSDRFTDDDGNPMEWEIKSISSKEHEQLVKDCTTQVKGVDKLDAERFTGELFAKTVVFPNLNDVELQNTYGVMSVYDLLSEMLLAGEVQYLNEEVQKICGFNRNELEEKIKEAKK